MTEINAKMVANLRAATGMGMMECKKALVEAEGNMAKAEELLRIKSGAKASKVAGRTAAEGVVVSHVDGQVAVLVEVNCETDFVAKDQNFLAYAKDAAAFIAKHNPSDIASMSQIEHVENLRKEIVAKLGENISVRRFVRYESQNKFASYLHGSRIGVLVEYDGADQSVAKDVAMHIAASKPICVSKEEVASDLIETERRIYTEQALQSGKPAEIVAKMVDGRISKYLAEVTLLGQAFVKQPDMTVEGLLKEKSMNIHRFNMFVVGEGIEKKEVDFAAEVAAAAKG
jgi:elongation factor Ts